MPTVNPARLRKRVEGVACKGGLKCSAAPATERTDDGAVGVVCCGNGDRHGRGGEAVGKEHFACLARIHLGIGIVVHVGRGEEGPRVECTVDE